jgi:hypothetical protein
MRNKDKNNLIIILGIVIVLLLFGRFGFGGAMMEISNFGFVLFNSIVGILLLVLIIFGIYWLIKKINNERA